MNIGIIRMRYNPYGGAEVFVSRFVGELLKRGHTCHIFAAKWEENISPSPESPPVTPLSGVKGGEVSLIPSPPAGEGKGEGRFSGQNHASASSKQGSKLIFHKIKTFGPSFLRLLTFAINSYFAVRKASLDIILSFDRTLYQDIYRAGDGCHKEWLIQRAKGKRQRAKGFYSMLYALYYVLNPLHLTLLYLEKRLFQSKSLKFVVANSNRGKAEIIRHYKLPEEKICVIYNGIDLNQFDLNEKGKTRAVYRERLGIKNETTLLFVGSGFERKGLRFLIEALGTLKKESKVGSAPQKVQGQNGGQSPPNKLKLIVVGKGKNGKYQEIADRCGAGTDITFVGPVKDAQDYYYAADIFVLPSIYEPFSNACLEAMASGLPVVTSRINGVSEILSDGKNGMIVEDPADSEELASKIRPLLDREVRSAAGSMARQVAENYTIEKNVEEFLKLIEVAK